MDASRTDERSAARPSVRAATCRGGWRRTSGLSEGRLSTGYRVVMARELV